jgi:hypothetical protein
MTLRPEAGDSSFRQSQLETHLYETGFKERRQLMPLEKVTEYFRGNKDPLTADISEGVDPGITEEMPVVPHKVLYANIPFYEDDGCTQPVTNGTLMILRPLDSDGFDELAVVPTEKNYEVGQYLNWQLDKEDQWEDNYFRNPISGQVEKAWTLHVAFVGNIVSDEAVSKDQERLEKLEAMYLDGQEGTPAN